MNIENLESDIFVISSDIREKLDSLINEVISLLPAPASYTFSYAYSNSDVGTRYAHFDRYIPNLFDTRITNIISLHSRNHLPIVESTSVFYSDNSTKALIKKKIDEIVTFCRHSSIPFFGYVIVSNGYFNVKEKGEVFQKADIEFISRIVTPRDLQLDLEIDIITKSLRYVCCNYNSAEKLLAGAFNDCEIYYPME